MTTDARTLLQDLIHAARSGAIIPVKLAGQLEALAAALDSAAEPPPAPLVSTSVAEQAQLISHAIHDLRLPLTSIRGYSDMLGGMGPLNEMQQQFLTTIRTNVKRMESLLTDVGDITKIQAGTLHVALKMDMVKNVAALVEKKLRPLADELGRELIFDFPQGLPLLNTDGELLARALTKIVENALRYTPQGGSVRMTAQALGSQVQISIEDNGIGMQPAELLQLGTPYYRGESDAVLQHKGSGLGLPIAYGILRMLGGTVEVQSEPQVGTRFSIMLMGLT